MIDRFDGRIASSVCLFEIMNKESNDDDKNDAKEQTRCFVCDDEVLGRYYALATCRTQSSRSRVIEKLGELVGEGYMVVISEDDVICRSCGILINTLDRLEVEMRKARDHILHFLERKYSLRDGELCGSDDRPKPCQPPQITRSGMKEISACYTKLPNQNDDSNSGEENNRILMKSHSWLQCDKCKYTTHLNSFMVHHLRDHIKGKLFCDNCGHLLMQQTKKHNCNKANDLGNKENKTDNSDKNDTTETTYLGQTQSTLPITQTMPPPLIGLSNCDHLYISNTLPTSDSQIPTSSQKPIYILQSIDKPDIDNSKMAKSNSDPTQKIETNKSKDKKHLLILKDDGSLEMVEIPYEMEANIESVFE